MNMTNKMMKISVGGSSESPTQFISNSGNFQLMIDEPAVMGGTDEGPSPMQVMLMSLAGCLSITGHAVAHQNKLVLKKIDITIDGEMDPSGFMGLNPDVRAGFNNIRVNVQAQFVGATKKEIDQWLEETERRCPITDTIKSGTHIHLTYNEPVNLS